MAKGQNRGNREPKKPKAKKTASGAAVSIMLPKSMTTQTPPPKKKG